MPQNPNPERPKSTYASLRIVLIVASALCAVPPRSTVILCWLGAHQAGKTSMNSDSLFACKMWKLIYVFTFCFSLSVAVKTVTQVPNTHNRLKKTKVNDFIIEC